MQRECILCWWTKYTLKKDVEIDNEDVYVIHKQSRSHDKIALIFLVKECWKLYKLEEKSEERPSI